MSDYRRYFVPGSMIYLTVVTYGRRPILTTDHGRCFLRNAIKKIQRRFPFTLFATCLLPDHWHLIMQLPSGDANYSVRIKRIKEEFTIKWRASGLPEAEVTKAQRRKGERGIWQPRAWEHTIVDEKDLERCVDYIHWNPRKHGLVARIQDWKWSSFHRFVNEGQYEQNWGGEEPSHIQGNGPWGE
ncbi:Transposase IS200 like protein [Rubripirellula obstinata]|uniref:Transposase IS200 like protein n=1 Tax=Rubripirellula obstinata TaxID=406547 RepID=A0A5B1CK06_9BACT|nr:transposase [Rubripirellula obstinata]KAA1260205.1 Transposase IS200 like protein [Rubripirellula obstinata]